MAESYRGLTIRIGGDTTKLSNALREANRAASQTASELRKVNQALRLDPTNIEAYNLQVGYMSNKASETAMKLHQLRDAAQEVAATEMKMGLSKHAETRTVEELAKATEDAALAAASANTRYNTITDSLARMNTQVSNLAKEASGVKFKELTEEFSKVPVGGDLDKLIERLTQLPSVIAPSKDAIATFRQQIEGIYDASASGLTNTKQAISEYKSLLENLMSSSVTSFKFDSGNIDLETLRTALEEIGTVIDLDESKVDAFLNRASELKVEFRDAKTELERAKIVQEFEDLQVEIVKTESTIKNVARAMADMKAPSMVAREMTALSENIKVLESSFGNLMETSRTMGGIIDSESVANIGAAEVAMKSLADAQTTVVEEAARVRGMMDAYDATSIAAYTESSKSASQQLFDAAVAAQEAQDAYSDLSGQVAAWNNELTILNNSVEQDTLDVTAMAEGDKDAAEAKELLAKTARENAARIKELEASISQATPKLARLKQEAEDASKKLEMSKGRSELEKLPATLVEVESRLRRVAEAAVDLSQNLTLKIAFGDTSGVVDSFMSDFEAAASRADVFGKAFQFDPSRIELADRHTQSLSEAITSAQRAMAALDAAVSDIDPTEMQRLKDTYVTTENAVRQTREATIELSASVEKAKSALANMVSGAGYDELRDKILNLSIPNDAFASFDMTAPVRKAREELVALSADLAAAKAASDNAAKLDRWQQYETKIEGIRNAVSQFADIDMTPRLDDSIIKDLTAMEEMFGRLSTTTAGGSMGQLEQELKDIETDYQALAKSAEKYAQAAKDATPKDEDLRTVAYEAIEAAIIKATERAKKYHEIVDSFDRSKIDLQAIAMGTVSSKLEKAQKDVANLESAEKKLQKAFDDVVAEMGRMPEAYKSTDEGRAKYERLESTLAAIRSELSSVRDAADAAGDELSNAVNTQAFSDMVNGANMATAAIGQLEKLLDSLGKKNTDDAAFQQAFNQVVNYAERAGRAMVESSNTIDAAYRDMRKTVQGTEQDFENLRNKAIEFSQTHAVSADTILEIESLGGQLGLAASSLQSFGENISNLDIATDMDADELALKMGQLQNVMDDFDASEFTSASDAVVRLGNNMAAQESAIINIAQRMSSVANTAKMSTPDLFALSAAIASTGQRSESAATAVSNTITGISAAVATGGSDLQEFAKIASMSAEDFANTWETDPTAALKAFIDGLESLSDTNTGAIAALENMGISSVRQETALLGLASTVDTLDNALTMSRDAWNGVADEWGDAGDAANEAANKSQGFSGALQILKNNASDLAAALGEGMAPVLSMISEALKTVTDILNMIPAPIRSVIVSIAAVAAIGGTAAQTIGVLSSGMSSIASGTASTIPVIKSLADAIANLIPVLKTASGGAGSLATALSTGLVGAAIIAAVAAIGMVVDGVQKLQERQKEAELATTGLTNAMREAKTGYDEYKDKVEETGRSVKQLRDDVDALTKSQAEFAQQMQEEWKSLGNDTATVGEYASQIIELSSSTNMTKDEMNVLNDSITKFNELTGASIPLLGSENDQLQLNKDEIQEVADAWQRQQEIDIASDQKKEALEKQAEANRILAEYTDAVTEAQERNAVAGGLVAGAANSATAAAVNSGQAYQQAKRDLEASTAAIEQAESVIAKGDYAFNSFGAAIYAAGVDVRQFGQLTEDEQASVEQAFMASGRTIEDLAKILAAYGVQVTNFANDAGSAVQKLMQLSQTAEQSMTKAPTSVINAQKKADTKAYNERKKQLDRDYKDKQRQYQKDEKALQKELDKEVKDRQKALDAEYKDAQKASQKYLKEYKKAQEQQVEAFKAATDARVKEIERERDAKQALLDAEYERYDSEYDEQIAAIEREQEAEDLAREQKERSEKLTELQHNIDTAKSDRKRKEAEKAMSDYKEELAAKDRKTQRQNQMQAIKDAKDALKQQKSDRDEHLKDSYTTAVESYKEERASKLKVLQEGQEEEYARVQEAESDKLEALKESHQNELEALREHNSDRLEAYKEGHQDDLQALKDMQNEELEQLKAGQDAYIKAMQDGTAKAIDNVNNALEEAASKIPYVGDLIKAGLVNISEDGVISFTEEFKKMPGVTEEVMDLIRQMIQSSVPGVKGAVEQVGNEAARAVEDATESIMRKLEESGTISADTYKNALSGMPSAVREVFESLGLTVDSGLGDVARKMLESGDISLSQYLGIMNGMPNSLSAIFNETGLRVAGELGLLTPQISGAAQAQHDAVVTPLSTLPSEAQQYIDSTNSAIRGIGNQTTLDSVSANAANVKDAVTNGMSGMAVDAQNNVIQTNSALTGIGDQATVDTTNANMGTFVDIVNSHTASISTSASNSVTNANAELSNIGGGDTAKNVSDNVTNVAKSGLDALGNANDAYDTAGGNLIAKLANGAGSRSTDVDNAAKAVVLNAANTANNEMKSSTETVGGNFDVGIANGITNSSSVIETAAKNAAIRAYNAANETLGIHSPSRKGMEVGKFFDLGIAKGTIANAGEIESAVKSIGSMMADSMEPESGPVGFDFVSSIAESMRANENKLREQVARMTEIIERGFNPDIGLDAAFDAMDRISAGKHRYDSEIASNQSNSYDNRTFNVNISIPEMVVREEADISRISQQIALRVERQIKSAIG